MNDLSLEEIQNLLVQRYKEMYSLTNPRCGGSKCRKSQSPTSPRCCDGLWCAITADFALEVWGVELTPANDGDIPFLGPKGCIVEPHLRPICTVHDCAIYNIGEDREDPEWTENYFRLREEINRLEGLRLMSKSS